MKLFMMLFLLSVNVLLTKLHHVWCVIISICSLAEVVKCINWENKSAKKHTTLPNFLLCKLYENYYPEQLLDYKRVTVADFVDILVITEGKLDQSYIQTLNFLLIGSPNPLGKIETGMVVDFSCISRKTFLRKNYLSIYHLKLK